MSNQLESILVMVPIYGYFGAAELVQAAFDTDRISEGEAQDAMRQLREDYSDGEKLPDDVFYRLSLQ